MRPWPQAYRADGSSASPGLASGWAVKLYEPRFDAEPAITKMTKVIIARLIEEKNPDPTRTGSSLLCRRFHSSDMIPLFSA